MIFDTHTHLDMLKNLDKIITNARKTKVKTIITNSVNIFSLKKSLKIQKKYPEIVKLAAGLYPEETLSVTDFNELERFINKNKNSIIAIGEIGLDKTEKLDFEIQKKFFIKQLNLARKYSLPTIIHTRKAEKEVLEILKNYLDLKIVLHCFCGKLKLIQQAKNLGCYFSIPTNIVRSEQFQRIVKDLPKEKILTETDAPYLSPFKDKPNEPAFIKESIKKISEIWKINKKEVEKILENNFERCFNQ
jgi:TatD DNase family protein